MTPEKIFGIDIRFILAVMAVVAVALSLIAFDRAPLISRSDEVIQNDAALTLAETGEFRASSYEGTIIGAHFAHYPPVYMLAKAAVFRAFGLSEWTLRGPSLLAHAVMLALLAYCVWRLIRTGRLSAWLGVAAFALCAFDVSMLVLARWGRMEPLVAAFGLGAWAILLSRDSPCARRWPWLAAGLLLGLAAATHPSAIFLISPFIAAVFFVYRKSWQERAGIAVLPFLIAGGIWVAVHGAYSLAAVSEFLELNRMQGFQGFSLGNLIAAAAALDARTILQSGATGLAVVVAALIGTSAGGVWLWRRSRANPEIAVVTLGAIANLVFAFGAIGLSITRNYVLMPAAVLSFAIVLERLKLAKPAWKIGVAIAVLNLALCGAYLVRAIEEYDARNPANSLAVISTAQPGMHIAAVDSLWFALKSRGIDFRAITFGFMPSAQYWRARKNFDEFEQIYLTANDELLAKPALADWPRTALSNGIENFVRLDRPR